MCTHRALFSTDHILFHTQFTVYGVFSYALVFLSVTQFLCSSAYLYLIYINVLVFSLEFLHSKFHGVNLEVQTASVFLKYQLTSVIAFLASIPDIFQVCGRIVLLLIYIAPKKIMVKCKSKYSNALVTSQAVQYKNNIKYR